MSEDKKNKLSDRHLGLRVFDDGKVDTVKYFDWTEQLKLAAKETGGSTAVQFLLTTEVSKYS